METEEHKRVHFRCPISLWKQFEKIYPYKGEPTAFFNRCVQQVVMQQKRKLSKEDIVGLAKEDE